MVGIKKRKSKAYILLESLVSLAIFSIIASTFLLAIEQGHRQVVAAKREQEVLQVVKTALQTQQHQLSLNGVAVEVMRSNQGLGVYHKGERILYVEKR